MTETKNTQMVEGLKPTASLFEERWDIFKRNHLAYFSFIFLMVLFIFAIIGKILTRWVVLFDPKLVRLPEKFLPPLTPFTSKIIPIEEAPMFNMYILGTD